MAYNRGHTHLIVFVHACGYYSRAAIISFAELHVQLLIGVRLNSIRNTVLHTGYSLEAFLRPQIGATPLKVKQNQLEAGRLSTMRVLMLMLM